jgi:hypothetical protein
LDIGSSHRVPNHQYDLGQEGLIAWGDLKKFQYRCQGAAALPQITDTPNKCMWKLPTSTQICSTWHTETLDMVVLPSTGASHYHNCWHQSEIFLIPPCTFTVHFLSLS